MISSLKHIFLSFGQMIIVIHFIKHPSEGLRCNFFIGNWKQFFMLLKFPLRPMDGINMINLSTGLSLALKITCNLEQYFIFIAASKDSHGITTRIDSIIYFLASFLNWQRQHRCVHDRIFHRLITHHALDFELFLLDTRSTSSRSTSKVIH